MVGATTGYIMWSMNIVGELEFASIVNVNIRYWVCIMRYWRWCICGGRRMGCIMRVASRLPWHRHHCRRARQALQRVGRSDLLVPCQSEVGIVLGMVWYNYYTIICHSKVWYGRVKCDIVPRGLVVCITASWQWWLPTKKQSLKSSSACCTWTQTHTTHTASHVNTTRDKTRAQSNRSNHHL